MPAVRPEQLAASLVGEIRLGTAARALRDTADGVRIATDTGSLSARAVVIAVGPQHVAGLTALPAPETHGLTAWWFRATGEPRTGPFLVLDASRSGGGPAGPIWNAAVRTTSRASTPAPPRAVLGRLRA